MAEQFEQRVGEINEHEFDQYLGAQSGKIAPPPKKAEPHTQPTEPQN